MDAKAIAAAFTPRRIAALELLPGEDRLDAADAAASELGDYLTQMIAAPRRPPAMTWSAHWPTPATAPGCRTTSCSPT